MHIEVTWLKKSGVINWTVLVNSHFDYVAIESLKLYISGLTKEDLMKDGGWQIIGYPAFTKADEAIRYCRQLGFEPVVKKKKKRVKL